jgi:hypothetical protein
MRYNYNQILEIFKPEYLHYFHNRNKIQIFKRLLRNLKILSFGIFHKNEKVIITKDVVLNFNLNIHNQMFKSINLIFDPKKYIFISDDKNIIEELKENNFECINTNNLWNLNYSELLKIIFNFLFFLIKLIIIKKENKELFYYLINSDLFQKIISIKKNIVFSNNIKIINFDDADIKTRIINFYIFNKNETYSIQQGLILDNSIEYLYPISKNFIVYGDYFKEKLIKNFNLKRNIISVGVFELIHLYNHNLKKEHLDSFLYISQPYVSSLFKSFYEKIIYDLFVSKIFKNKLIYKKYHPFEGRFTKFINKCLCHNFKNADGNIIQMIFLSKNIITLSSTAAFYSLLFDKNVIIVKKNGLKSLFFEFEHLNLFTYLDETNYKNFSNFGKGRPNKEQINYLFSGKLKEQYINYTNILS